METEAIMLCAFPALFYTTMIITTNQILGYGEDQAYVESKNMFIACLLASFQLLQVTKKSQRGS